MSHPTPDQLLEHYFEELTEQHTESVAAHLAGCEPCRVFFADLDAIESALALGPEETPPTDGLERVLDRVGAVRPERHRQDHRVWAILPSLAAIAGGVVMIQQGGVAGALAFFLGGALVTLAIAPVLILESQRSSS